MQTPARVCSETRDVTMGKKQINVLCVSCESPLRADSAFCPNCGRPTLWASHDERVEWEVRQWRASRARAGGSTTTMMLVRTEAGYEPSPMRPGEQYVWDRPLHPEEREARPFAYQPTPKNASGSTEGGNGRAEQAARAAVAELAAPRPEVAEPVAPARIEHTTTVEVTDHAAGGDHGGAIGISRKAVAVGLLLAVGLPLSGKAMNLARRSSPSAKARVAAPAAAAGSIRPLVLRASRSGFTQVTPDAVRYAVVVRNPNRGFTAYAVSVSISMYDGAGRLIGTTTERLGSVIAGGSVAVAGQTGVSGQVSKLRVETSAAAFEPARSTRGFVVRGVQMSRRGGELTVRASVSGVNPAYGARLVVVYLDRAGKILGGDFAYVDVPSAPRAATAVVTTSGVGRTVDHAEAYVVTSP